MAGKIDSTPEMTDNHNSLTNKSNGIDMAKLNLDNMDTGQLKRIIKDEGMPHVYQRYAASKLNSIELRLQGRIDKALRTEKLCDAIYDQMLISYRW